MSVLGRPLDVIDDEHRRIALLRFQLEAELLLQRGEGGRAIRVDVGKATAVKGCLQEDLRRQGHQTEVASDGLAVGVR